MRTNNIVVFPEKFLFVKKGNNVQFEENLFWKFGENLYWKSVSSVLIGCLAEWNVFKGIWSSGVTCNVITKICNYLAGSFLCL